GGQVVEHLAVHPVADADLQRLQAVEHIQLGQGDAVDAVDGDRLAYQHGVEPAATTGPAGVDPDFPTDGGEVLAHRVVEFAGEGSLTDPGGVGLHDAQHVTNPL